ncbi:MAG TPA: hypothetical protein VFZ98_07255 [Vicinamibacterales bacterium]
MDWVLAAVALSIAIIVVAALAHHAFMRWLDDRARARVQENVLAESTARLDSLDEIIKKLAIDWRQKFTELETDWKKLKEHAQSQYAGTLAQIESQQARGFRR